MRSRSDGFSLIETLLAMFLLSLALLFVAPLFVYARKATAASGDIGSTGAIAVRRMELLRQTPFLGLTAGGSLTNDVAGFFDNSTAGYGVRWLVTDDANPAVIKTIQVRVVSTRAVLGVAKVVTLSAVMDRDQ